MKNLFILLILTMLLSSCEYYTDQKVKVFDKTSNLPVLNADIRIAAYEFLTDSMGFCHMSRLTSDLTERTIRVQKEGYVDFKISLKLDGHDILYRQTRDDTYLGNNSFAVMRDTLVVYLEKKPMVAKR